MSNLSPLLSNNYDRLSEDAKLKNWKPPKLIAWSGNQYRWNKDTTAGW
jgi:hypothetical protein